MEPDAVQRENKPLECRLILLGALRARPTDSESVSQRAQVFNSKTVKDVNPKSLARLSGAWPILQDFIMADADLVTSYQVHLSSVL